ncbi:hypothetical protein A2U01_0054179, partial [Trifolium medium]|nr:hypothetical protein [Trifolium medium]
MNKLKISHGKLKKHLDMILGKICAGAPCCLWGAASRPAELGGHVFALPFARRASLAAPRA